MGVRSITVDAEVYRLLCSEKRGDESLNSVIRRRILGTRTGATLLRNLKRMALSEDALDQTERLIRARKNSLVASPVVDLGE